MDYQRDSFRMLPGYMEGVTRAGGVSVMLPLTNSPGNLTRLLDIVDGVLMAGGQDVEPEVYGETRLSVCGEVSPERDAMEAALLDEAIRRGKPILGICRGIQFLNVHLGGTLWQDLPTQRPLDTCRCQKPPYDRSVHEVRVLPGTPLWELTRTETMPVNSCHHQAVKELAAALVPMAMSEDGLVEAAYLPNRPFVWTVQRHPEFSHKRGDNSMRLFRALVDACKENL